MSTAPVETPAAAPATTAPVTEVVPTPAAAAPAPLLNNKVFVGNLSFKTREPDLAKAFEEVGPVKSTNIIARGPRSLGYGFVEFETEEDAAKSVGVMNKRVIDGRPVNVELARPRAAPGTGPRAPRRYPPRRFPHSPVAGQQMPPQQAVPALPQQQFQQPRYPRGPRFLNRAPMGQQMVPQQQQFHQGGRPQQMQQMRPQQMQQMPVAGYMPRRPFVRRPRVAPVVPQTPQEPSKTTLFVANLPFVVDNEGLLEIFDGVKVKEARVVVRPNGKSKGYGFVTFETEEEQVKAMNLVDQSTVEGRVITVRPALAPFRRTAPAPAPAAPVAAAAPATEVAPAAAAAPAESK